VLLGSATMAVEFLVQISFLIQLLQPIFGVIACSVLASPKRTDDPPRATSTQPGSNGRRK
jgi:hypothetical protein